MSYNGAPLPGHVRSVMSSSGSHNPNQVVVELMWTRGFTSSDTGVYRCEAGNSIEDITLRIGMCLVLVHSVISSKNSLP